MIAYLKMYLRKHKGKAFPVKLDFSVYAQAVATSAGKGGLSEDQKEAIKAGKAASSKVESLTSQLASLKTTVAERKKVKNKSTKTCNFCGLEGHFACQAWARWCPRSHGARSRSTIPQPCRARPPAWWPH